MSAVAPLAAGLFPGLAPPVLVDDGRSSVGRAALEQQVAALAAVLLELAPRAVALIADNGPDWIVADLALQRARLPSVPLPLFFTPAQREAALAAAGVDVVLAGAGLAAPASHPQRVELPSASLSAWRGPSSPAAARMPAGTGKVTFTSGTTGAPKGVCLADAHQWQVARSLAAALAHTGVRRHLCVLPLPVLLENVAGVYTRLLAGGEILVPSLTTLGFAGAAGLDLARFTATIAEFEPDSLILLPQMLKAWTELLEGGLRPPSSLRFVAVGGAKVPTEVLLRARRLGLPVYEGYGLSECASVVALNVPGADRPGSVGRPLAHVTVGADAAGELQVAGPRFLGYLGDAEAAPAQRPLPTGDLGGVDDDGFVSITGRRKNIYITSFGRNVSPEWPEAELMAEPEIAQAAVFGEAEPQARAVLVAASAAVTDPDLAAAVGRANGRLPDYARIAAWIRAREPFTAANGLATANGRPRREAIHTLHAPALSAQPSFDPGGNP